MAARATRREGRPTLNEAGDVSTSDSQVPTRTLRHLVPVGGVGAWEYRAGDAITVEAEGSHGLERVGVRVINWRATLLGAADWVVNCDVEAVGTGAQWTARGRHLPRLYETTAFDGLFGVVP